MINLPMKTFRFYVILNNTSPGIYVEHRAMNVNDATRALSAQYGATAKISFAGMVKNEL